MSGRRKQTWYTQETGREKGWRRMNKDGRNNMNKTRKGERSTRATARVLELLRGFKLHPESNVTEELRSTPLELLLLLKDHMICHEDCTWEGERTHEDLLVISCGVSLACG